ncbi:acetolactate synthase AlsS [Oenococcus alcoholitolerans]|uniref:acetolactate synthase AlsS n=1 Tax=Oenococcus alcoholitolerans TaxID=931074 RepID=UPI003F715C3B
MSDNEKTGSESLIQSLIDHNIKYVFGIPGAKVDRLFEDLEHSDLKNKPELIVSRHEQNAAFIAAGIGRITGHPGVVAVTSGPGASNLATGLVTATAEGDPVIAIAGQVPQDDLYRLTHQSINSVGLMSSITKYSAQAANPDNISEILANAYQAAQSGKKGAAFISVPQNILSEKVSRPNVKNVEKETSAGILSKETADKIIEMIKNAKLPVILTGMRASDPDVTTYIRKLLKKVPLPVVETFQAAGIISHDLESLYFGRVGLFRNQIGDTLLKQSDLVIAIGYDPIEYEARNWNKDRKGKIVSLDTISPELTTDYQPDLIFTGDLAKSIDFIKDEFTNSFKVSDDGKQQLQALKKQFDSADLPPKQSSLKKVHPLAIVQALQKRVNDQTTVTVDVGSHYIWLARHFRSYQPRHLLFSNGMQTLGVSLPWAIAAALVRPEEKIVSVSGDGGFLFSGQELEVAVRKNLNIVQLIWNDGYYDMVRFQEKAKYGQDAGVQFGPVDFVKYAESFGAKGLRVDENNSLDSVLDKAFAAKGPVLVDIPVDYSENIELKEAILPGELN